MLERILFVFYRNYMSLKWNIKTKWLTKSFFDDYKFRRLPIGKIHSIHKKGFDVETWMYSSINNENYKNYLSTVDYYRMHPINGTYSKWIDDKLTLKYICSGTIVDKYLPEYYFLIDDKNEIHPLMDYKSDKSTVFASEIIDLLKEKGTLAIKLCEGAIGQGFIKGEYKDSKFYLNGEVVDLQELTNRIGKLKNYLVTEYFYPHKDLQRFCDDRINCTRVLLGRIDDKFEVIKSYIRFGTKKSGFVENYGAGGVLCYLEEDGSFVQGNIMDKVNMKNVIIHNHPDNNEELKGQMPLWDEILEANEAFDHFFPQMKYLGIDYVVTSDNKVKILEINSLTSLDALQFYGSIFETRGGDFFKKLMK